MKKNACLTFCKLLLLLLAGSLTSAVAQKAAHPFNGYYEGDNLERIAFPLGGIGAGMVCLDGTGSLSHLSIEHKPDMNNYPYAFAALYVKGVENGARVIETPVPVWKYYVTNSSRGGKGTNFGLPRFRSGRFIARFPFASLELEDQGIPVEVTLTGWSPFIPGDADNSSLPVGVLEYTFRNPTDKNQEIIFSYHAPHFLAERSFGRITEADNGFTLVAYGNDNVSPKAFFRIFTDREAVVDHSWFDGRPRDASAILWKDISRGNLPATPPVRKKALGASLYVPVSLDAGEETTVKVNFCWYVLPDTTLSIGREGSTEICNCGDTCLPVYPYYKPWYVERFNGIDELTRYWVEHADVLRHRSSLFRDAFYSSTLPPEVMEAVAANLTILKSPTVLRQHDGKLWGWEGCDEERGCCYGSCTHVWNYAQSIPHLFPSLERTLRETEFFVSQDVEGHQAFRSNLPISCASHNRYAASDGQLGGIMKAYREWRISGDTDWLRRLYPSIKQSLDYCIATWDPKHKGVLEEPHHNTYDIEFWGPDGMCTSFYLGALTAIIEMGKELDKPVKFYEDLLKKGKKYMEKQLFNGEYFYQQTRWKDLVASDPVKVAEGTDQVDYSEEALELLEKEGPKYQYGTGCLSDGVLGMWMADVCGLDEVIENEMVKSHLLSVYRYNLKKDLSLHVNTQRPTYALGNEGGLLLCSWPRGGKPSLPFFYSNEVWTGVEYHVAGHLMMKGEVEKGLDIVRTCRERYDGSVRNPFNEWECGFWYARAMSSYGLLQALTGIRYDAVSRTLYIDSRIGNDFSSFFCCKDGFGNAGLRGGVPFVKMKYGKSDIEHIYVSGKKIK
ncbi:MAG TPA: hypothetical protein ENF21_06785 [Bacteroidetes bacterium]|nr:hypothetical protein [Bacteroidota bacterium]